MYILTPLIDVDFMPPSRVAIVGSGISDCLLWNSVELKSVYEGLRQRVKKEVATASSHRGCKEEGARVFQGYVKEKKFPCIFFLFSLPPITKYCFLCTKKYFKIDFLFPINQHFFI